MNQKNGENGAPDALAGLRVFLVEDDLMILFALESVVEHLGCTVVGTAVRVLDALAFFEANVFDIAIMDLKLSDGCSDALVAALVARGTPFILTSGAPSSTHAHGPNGAIFLSKPYTDRELHKALLDTVARSPDRARPS